MAVTGTLPELRSPNWVGRVILILILLLALALAGVAMWAWWQAHAALPQVDGVITVPGLSAKVRVVRNEQGVPAIEAATLEDLFFAQGYVTAQDRLWQMDILRRAGAGELSEIIGKATLKVDRRQRILGLRGAAETAVKAIPDQQRPFFEAYTRGVNAFMESHRDRLPIEFRLLKYEPRPWTVTDSLVIGANLVEGLNHYSYARALTREKILAKLGPDLTADLYVNSSWRDRPPTDVKRAMDQEPPAAGGSDDDDEEDEEPGSAPTTMTSALPAAEWNMVKAATGWHGEMDTPRPGSNNWVVAGTHTTTGFPLLSDDMHLEHEMPNLWYEAHLTSGDFDVAGVTLPGVPFVIVGHNRRIGWGFTNVGPTVEDDFIEEFNAQGQYKTPKGWVEPEHRREIIRVKGMEDETVNVLTTRHGPIITEMIPGETRRIALRWTLYDGMGLTFFEIDSAQNWEEFRKALAGFTAPGQNVVYADVDGHIAYQTTGRVPIRAAGDGSLPVSGSDDAHEWTGWIPFDELPRIYDPPNGIIATANGRIVPDGYKYSISTEWEAPWRTDRIYRVLESGKKFAPADMLALQTDVSSAFDRLCAEKFVYALDHAPRLSERAKRAADILRDWDGRMSADSVAATIETNARHELTRMLLEPKLGPAEATPSNSDDEEETHEAAFGWTSYRWNMSTVWLENVLSKQPARWLPPGFADYGALLTAAMEHAMQEPGVPSDLAQWKWGETYPLDLVHPVLRLLPVVGRFTGPGRNPLGGDHYTVDQVYGLLGPSERLTWNFADFDSSTLNIVTGESGEFLSPHYMDQWPAWYGGSTFTLPFSPAAVEQHRAHELILQAR